MTFCPDCAKDGKQVSVVFDGKYMGEVCPRCERIFSIFEANGNNHRYVTEKACKEKMRRDSKARRHDSVETRALVDRILNPID